MVHRGWHQLDVPTGWVQILRGPRPKAEKWRAASAKNQGSPGRRVQSGQLSRGQPVSTPPPSRQVSKPPEKVAADAIHKLFLERAKSECSVLRRSSTELANKKFCTRQKSGGKACQVRGRGSEHPFTPSCCSASFTASGTDRCSRCGAGCIAFRSWNPCSSPSTGCVDGVWSSSFRRHPTNSHIRCPVPSLSSSLSECNGSNAGTRWTLALWIPPTTSVNTCGEPGRATAVDNIGRNFHNQTSQWLALGPIACNLALRRVGSGALKVHHGAHFPNRLEWHVQFIAGRSSPHQSMWVIPVDVGTHQTLVT